MLVRSYAASDYIDVEGYATATDAQRDHLRRLYAVVHAARSGVGLDYVNVTSWLRAGGSKPHQEGAAIDFTGPTKADTLNLWLWIANFRDADDFGEVAFEQPKTGVTGHVHLTRPGYGGQGQILYQNESGGFVLLDRFLVGRVWSGGDRRDNGDGSESGIVLPDVRVFVGDRSYRLVPIA